LKKTPKEMNKFECQLCKEKHYIPEKGFFVNKRIQNGLNIKLNSLKLNPVYEECKKEIIDAKNKIQKIENLESAEFEKSKKELAELIDRFDTFEISDNKFEEIKKSLKVLNGGLTRTLGENRYSVVEGKDYTFEFQEMDIEMLFGSFKEILRVIKHSIINYLIFVISFNEMF